MHHCVAFPAVSKRDIQKISTYGHAEIIILREDLIQLSDKVEKVIQFWNQKTRWNDVDFSKVKQIFIPTAKTPGQSYLEYFSILEQLDELTESQKRTVRQLTGPGKTVIIGGAGTGKTVLGMSKAQQLAADGKQVLFVCANRSLAEYLRREVEINAPQLVGNLKIDTASKFISETARAGKRGKEYLDYKESVERHDRFLSAISDQPIVFDCIILDEAQDIRKEDLELLEYLLCPFSEGGSILIFGDPNQQLALTRRESALDSQHGGLTRTLDVNCRNTYEIATIAHTYTRQPVETLESRSGIKIRNLETSGSLSELIKVEVAKIRNDYDPHSLAVLTLNGLRDIADDDPFFADGLEEEFHAKASIGTNFDRVPVYAIREFQGREADAIVVAVSSKSLLTAHSFENFDRLMKNYLARLSMQNGAIDDMNRVRDQHKRFVKRIKEDLVPQYLESLKQSDEQRTDRHVDFLVKQFQRYRRQEFLPNFKHPEISKQWETFQLLHLRITLYSMMTRARVILSVVADSPIGEFITSRAQTSDNELDSLLEDIAR